jgi:hypothetical protein
LLANEDGGALDFEPSHPRTRENITGIPFRYGNLGESEDAARKIQSDVALDTAGAGNRAYKSQCFTCARGYRTRVFEARLY